MTETASLIVSAKVEGADKLKSDLNTISNEAKKAEKSAQGLASSFTGLKVAVAAVASSAMLREFVKVADDMSLVNSRLKMATSSAAEYAKQQKALHAIARDTHADIKETINLYAKLAPALKNIGKSTEDTNNMVSSFTKALQLGGASAEEAAAAIKQFGQAMGSGALRGDEFNSIAEASPTLLRYMAEGLGVNVGKLRELGSEGKLTAEALSSAFEKVKSKIDSDFAQMPVTVGKAFTDLRTEINLIVGDINEVTGATQTISGAIKGFADILKNNRDSILSWGEHLGKLALAIGITKAATVAVIPTIRVVVASFTAAASSAGVMTAALTTARTAVMGLKAAFMGFLPTLAIFAAVEAFFALKDSMDKAKPSADKLNDALSKTNEELQKLTRNQRDAINLDLKASLDANFRKIDEINRKLEEHNKFGGIVKAYRLEADEIIKLKAERDGYIAQNSKIIGQRKEIASINSGIGAIETQQQKDAAYINSLEKKTKDLHVTTLPMLKKEASKLKKEIDEILSKPSDNIRVQVVQEETVEALRLKLEKTNDQIANFNKKAEDEAKRQADEAKRRAEELKRLDAQRLDDKIKHYEQIGDIEKANSAKLIKYEKELSEAVKRGGITRLEAAVQLEAKRKELSEKGLKDETERIKKQDALYLDYYITLEKYEEAWQIKRKEYEADYQKLVKDFGKEFADKWLKKKENDFKKSVAKDVKTAKTAFKDIKNSWADTVSSMSKTVDDGFFNFFIGKTKSLKKALKDMGTNLMRDFISPYARALSQGISGGFGSFLGGASNLASIASNLGLAKNNSGGWSGSVGGTPVELSSTGEILRGANALDKSTTNLLGSISNLQSAYQALTSGYKGLVSKFTGAPMNHIGTRLSLAGYDSLGLGFQGFGAGAQHALTGSILNGGGLNGSLSGAYSGAYAGGASLGGAALGYGVGYLGDRLFKANTHASSVGAVGGALGGAASAGAFGAKIGSSVGPWGAVIGAVAGALIGGAFGKKKATGSGISVLQDINTGDTLSNKNIRSYIDMQKKGWFSKKSWSELSDLDDASMREIGAQLNTMNRLASRAGALATLKLSAGKYSGGSLANEGLAKAILRSMTGQAEQTWAEVTQTSTKRKGLFGKLTGIFEKTFKFSPSTISDRLTKPLDDAITKSMNKAGLGELDKMARGGRGEYGKLLDGNIFGMGATRKLDDLLNLSRDETKVNQKLVDNPEFSRMWKDWEEQAKKANKKVIELMGESLGAIADTYKRLELLSVKNPIKQVETSMRQAFESFTDAAQALKLDIPKQMGSIADLSVEQMALAYRKAIASDFTKSNIDSLNSLVKAYEAARKAQDDYTKAILNFTQQVASTQAGFYSAHGIDSSFMNYQNIYTKFRTLIGALDKDIGEGHKQGVLKNGSFGDINSWAKHFLGLSSNELGGFLSGGNTELRQELLKLLTEYQNQVKSTGGHQFWLKSMADLETINKQIEALKLAQKAQSAQEQLKANAKANLDAQRAQLDLLKAQKSAVEKLANIVQKIRDKVIDRTTSPINYQTALEKARQAYAKGDYQNKAFNNLSSAADKQGQYFEETSLTYEEYKLNMLKMAGEIEGMAGGKSLEDINRAILEVEERIKKATKIFEEEFKNLNKTGQDQLAALEAQRQSLIENAKTQLDHMNTLLGASSPMVKYLRDILQYLIKPEIGKDGKPKAPNIPNYTTPGNVNNGITTANGALLSSALDKTINQTYLSVLGRSVEQQGLDYWRDRIKRGDTTAQGLGAELAKMAQALTGSNDRQAWIEWAKSKGYKPFAQGGIVTRPTRALIGEAGYPEAVIPLKGGNGVKVDMDGGFRILQRGIERLESVVRGMAKDIKEMALTDRGTTNGDERLVRLVGIPTVRIEK